MAPRKQCSSVLCGSIKWSPLGVRKSSHCLQAQVIIPAASNHPWCLLLFNWTMTVNTFSTGSTSTSDCILPLFYIMIKHHVTCAPGSGMYHELTSNDRLQHLMTMHSGQLLRMMRRTFFHRTYWITATATISELLVAFVLAMPIMAMV